MKITVIGNGISRRHVPLDKIKGITIGCNEIYRGFSPDYLMAVDEPILKEIHESNYSGTVVYRQNGLRSQGLLPKEHWHHPKYMNHHSSGNAGLVLATTLATEPIDLLGFDCQLGRVYSEHTPPSSWQLWINFLLVTSSKFPLRRVTGENSLEIPEVPSISVEDYIKELEV